MNESKSRGFYIALGICLVAVFVSAFFAYSNINKIMVSNKDGNDQTNESTIDSLSSSNNSKINKNSKNSIQKSASSTKDKNTAKQTSVKESVKNNVFYPSGKEIIKNFSDSKPIYSKTLNDWRIHNGVDFKAEKGSKIKSISGGVVKDVNSDENFGTTIIIDHNEFVAYYSGLDENVTVNKGDSVDAGQDIAVIGDIPIESKEESHLHLSIKKDNKFINPLEILEKSK